LLFKLQKNFYAKIFCSFPKKEGQVRCSKFYITAVFKIMRRISLLFLCLAFLIFSCKKNNQTISDCGPAPASCGYCDFGTLDYFSFTLVDKTTGTDLIFGINPPIAVSEIKLFHNTTPLSYQVPFEIDSTNKLLKSYKSSTFISRDTMWLKIKNDVEKKIVVITYCSKTCCSSNITEILYDGNTYFAGINDLIKIKY
jgi:hypothetical protein